MSAAAGEGAILWHTHAPGAVRATACTATIVEPSPAGPSYVLTAGHCAPEPGETAEIVYDATARNDMGRTVIDGRARASVPIGRVTRSPRFDLLWAPLPKKPAPNVPRHAFADRLPEPGAELTVEGFPGGMGPVAAACTLIGPVLRADRDLDGFRIDQEMVCPLRDTWRGMSGAAVLDPEGKVVGVVLAAALSGTALYFQPLLATNLRAAGTPITPGEGTGTRSYDNLRLGAGPRGYHLEARMEKGLLNGPATLYGPEGSPHARLTFEQADLRGPMMLFGPDGGVMLDATVAGGRVTIRRYAPPEAVRPDPADEPGDAIAPSEVGVARMIEWSLMGRTAN
jgi:hypothetical protein